MQFFSCWIAIGDFDFSKFWSEKQFCQLQLQLFLEWKKSICLPTARTHFMSILFQMLIWNKMSIVLTTHFWQKCVVNTGAVSSLAEPSVKEDELKIRRSPSDGAKRGIRVRPLHGWVTHFHSVTVYAALRRINGHCFTDEFDCVWTSADLYP